jgi:DNA/RNA-binding protein KIN17
MNSTRFLSLTEFAKHLGRTGVCHVDETEKGWFISWIDNSPKALAKAEANQKKERGEMDDEMRQRKLIQEQIERAREEGERRRKEALQAKGGEGVGESTEESKVVEEEQPTRELKREEGEKVALSLNFKATPSAAPSTSKPPSPPAESTSSESPALPTPASTFIAPPVKPIIGFTPKPNPLAAKRANPLKANPLAKKSNPLKSSSSASSASTHGGGEKRKAPMSAMEQIAMEEMARKQRRRD